MMRHAIETWLIGKGFDDGWAFNNLEGIVLWERNEPQPSEAELIAAGWIKPEQETPEQ